MKITNTNIEISNKQTHQPTQRERERIHVDQLLHGAPFWRDCAVKVVTGEVTIFETKTNIHTETEVN